PKAYIPSSCDVSGHRGHMSRDIEDKSRWAGGGAEGVIVAGRIEGEFADERPVLADDTDVLVGHQDVHAAAAIGGAEADVVESAEVAEGDAARLVDAVVADAVVRRWRGNGRSG